MRINSTAYSQTLSFPALEVRDIEGKGKGVFAENFIPARTLVCIGRLTQIVPSRTTHSFQMDWERHVEQDEPARLFNHACDFNLAIHNNEFGGYSFVSTRDIYPGEELCWDYGMTEAVSIAVGQCQCGSAQCKGRSVGFTEMSKQEQETLFRDGIAKYLSAWYLNSAEELGVLRS
jgi:uncharacterized protein